MLFAFHFWVAGKAVQSARGKMRQWRRGIFAALAWAVFLPAVAQNHQMGPGLPAAIDPAQGAAHLDAFREARLQGDFCLRFQLTHLPRRGDETVYEGVAWGTWNEQGPLTRFQLRPAAGSNNAPPDPALRDANTWEWLVQNGPMPRVWVLAPGEKTPQELPPAAWPAPLFAGLVYTPFDLLMPFLYWQKFEYHGPTRLRGRVADLYVMLPPSDSTAAPVEVALDREFNALLQAESLNDTRQPVRQFQILDFEKVEGQWMMKTLDLLDLTKRDQDQFEVTAAALNLRLDPAVFDPAHLAEPATLPPAAAWQSL
ncbi:MAG: hypothetical protein ABSH19_01380 [Opitutales bacterium]|jgi:hypothetical protein